MSKENNIENIYNLYVDDLFTYGTYLGFEKEVVKDAIHDVFYKFVSDKIKIEDISNPKFYLFRSLKNRLYDIHKSSKAHIGIDEIHIIETPNLPFNFAVNFENAFIEKEEQVRLKAEIENMLDSLTDRQREVIYLRYIQEYDYAQIAELLKISIHGCRKLVSKAMASLREKYASLIAILLILN